MRHCQTVFLKVAVPFCIFTRTLSVPVALHFHQHLVLSALFIFAFLVEWYFSILICISLMTNHVQDLCEPIGHFYVFFNSQYFTTGFTLKIGEPRPREENVNSHIYATEPLRQSPQGRNERFFIF